MNNIAIILLALIILMMPLIACVPNNNANETQPGESRMVIIEQTNIYDIVYDRYTKVMYAISRGGYNSGNFTLLVDSDGNPLLYGNWKEQNDEID